MKKNSGFSLIPAVATLCLTLSLFILPERNADAAPGTPGGNEIVLQHADGKEFSGRVYGDDLYHRIATQDEYTIVFKDGRWHYGLLSIDGSEVVASPWIVGDIDPAAMGLVKGIDVSAERRMEIIRATFDKRMRPMESRARFLESKILSMKALNADPKVVVKYEEDFEKTYKRKVGMRMPSLPTNPPTVESVDTSAPGYGPYIERNLPANVNGIGIYLSFQDSPKATTDTDVRLLLSGTGDNSVRTYFHRQSGQIDYAPPAPAAQIHFPARLDLYHDCVPVGLLSASKMTYAYGVDLEVMLHEIINQLDSSCVADTTTVNANNELIAFTIIYDGEREAGNLWPHAGRLDSPIVIPGTNIYVADYALCCARIEGETALGPACHEIAHSVCGFGDYYDYGSPELYGSGDAMQSAGVGVYCLMGYGCTSFPANSPFIYQYGGGGAAPPALRFTSWPAGINPYLKLKAGWVDEGVLFAPTQAVTYTLAITNRDRLVRRSAENPLEYFIFEHWSKTHTNGYNGYARYCTYLPPCALVKYDAGARNGGTAVWHVDETVMTRNEYQQGTVDSHYELCLVTPHERNSLANFNYTHNFFDREAILGNMNLGASDDFFSSDNTIISENLSHTDRLTGPKFWNGQSSAINAREFSSGRSISITFDQIGLEIPINVRASTTFTDSILIEWDYDISHLGIQALTDYPDPVYFAVFRATQPGGLRTKISEWMPNIDSFIDNSPGLALNTNYYYFVFAAATVGGGNSSPLGPYGIGRRVVARPPAPTVTPSKDALTISWPSIPASNTYELWRSLSSDIDADSMILLTTATALSYVDINITTSQIYYYRLRAYANGQYSEFSDFTAGHIPLGEPEVAVASSPSGCTLTWPLATIVNSTHFSVLRRLKGSSDSIIIQDWTTLVKKDEHTATYTDPTPEIGYEYEYEVAVSSSPTGDPRSAWSYPKTGYKQMGGPQNAVASANVENGILITWEPPSTPIPAGATLYYMVSRAEQSSASARNLFSRWITATEYLDTTAKLGIRYTYYVSAAFTVGGNQYGTKSSDAIGGRPLASTTVTASTNDPEDIYVSWTAVEGANTYTLYRWSDLGTDTAILYNADALSFIDKDRDVGYKHYYAVKAQYGADTVYSSNLSIPAIGMVKMPSARDVATTLPMVNGITIKWKTPWDVTGDIYYRVFYSATAGGPYTPLGLAWLGNAFQYTDYNNDAGYYVVRASRYADPIDTHASDYSAEVYGERALGPLDALTATDNEVQQVNLTWTSVPGITGYQLYRSESNDSTRAIEISGWLNGSATMFVDTSATPRVQYYYYSTGRNAVGQVSALQPVGTPGKTKDQYKLTVTNGSGSGYYDLNAKVTVRATPPDEDHYFDRWNDPDNVLDDSSVISTIATIKSAQDYVVTAEMLEYPARGILTVDPGSVIAGNKVVATLSFTKPITGALTIPLRYSTTHFVTISGGANFTFNNTQSASITLTSRDLATTTLSTLSVDAATTPDYYIPAGTEVNVEINQRNTSAFYAFLNPPAQVKEGETLILNVKGPADPNDQRELEFTISGALDAANYIVLNATSVANNKYRIPANVVCSFGIRIQILDDGIVNDARKMTIKLVQSYSKGTADKLIETPNVANISVLDGSGNIVSEFVNAGDIIALDDLLPTGWTAAEIVGDFPQNAWITDSTVFIPTAADAPFGWTSVITYTLADGTIGQLSLYYGPRLAFKDLLEVKTDSLCIPEIRKFNSKPKFVLSAFDPWKPTAKKPKKGTSKITNYYSGYSSVTINQPLKLKLYNSKELKTARKNGKFYADVADQVNVARKGIAANVLFTYKEKGLNPINCTNTTVGTVILAPPSTDSVFIQSGSGTVLRCTNISCFGGAPKAFIEYKNKSGAVVTKKLKLTNLGSSMEIALIPKPANAGAEDDCYILIDSTTGFLAIPYRFN